MPHRWTAPRIQGLKGREKIPVLTCYDWAAARLLDEAGVPVLLVGDSLGNVVLGYETTVRVRLDQMIHHASAVMRAAPRALVVVDMPFLSYQVSTARAVAAAGRIVQESGADAVKLEGGERTARAIRRIVETGVPVMGHLGLTPQSVLQMGGYPLQGTGPAADRLLDDARRLEDAGVFSLVLEKIPAELARRITASISVPTIGIGAGPHCDGQVLVLHDLLGLVPDFRPKFVRRYAELGALMGEAVAAFCRDVRDGCFPGAEHSFTDPADREGGPGGGAGTKGRSSGGRRPRGSKDTTTAAGDPDRSAGKETRSRAQGKGAGRARGRKTSARTERRNLADEAATGVYASPTRRHPRRKENLR